MARKKDSKATPTAEASLAPLNQSGQLSADPRATSSDWSGTLFQGWLSLAFWMVVGLLLEGLMAYKTPAYLQDSERREMFRLAHTHGTFLGLVLLAAALSADRFKLLPARPARGALRIGSALVPFGFLFAGIWHYESDPGLAIWLVPAGALMLIFGVISFTLATRP